MISITEKAREMLLQFQQKADDDIIRVLRVEIIGRGEKGFRYDLNLVDIEEKDTSDFVCEVDEMTVLIAERSSQYMEGATLDFVETLMGGGFQFENPNPMWVDDISVAVADVIFSDKVISLNDKVNKKKKIEQFKKFKINDRWVQNNLSLNKN